MTAEQDNKALAGEYVLGLLEGEAKMTVERRISSDADFAREVEAWRSRLGRLRRHRGAARGQRHLVGPHRGRSRGPAAQAPETPSLWSRFWNNLPALRVATLGTTFAALLLAVGLGFAIRAANQQPVMVAVLVDGNRTGAVVHTFADGRVVLLPLTQIDVPPGRAIEVWTLPSRERGPVSVGLMSRAQTLQLSLKDLPPPKPDQLFELTLEPATGSPTGRPTGPILFKGNTALAL